MSRFCTFASQIKPVKGDDLRLNTCLFISSLTNCLLTHYFFCVMFNVDMWYSSRVTIWLFTRKLLILKIEMPVRHYLDNYRGIIISSNFGDNIPAHCIVAWLRKHPRLSQVLGYREAKAQKLYSSFRGRTFQWHAAAYYFQSSRCHPISETRWRNQK